MIDFRDASFEGRETRATGGRSHTRSRHRERLLNSRYFLLRHRAMATLTTSCGAPDYKYLSIDKNSRNYVHDAIR